MVVDLDVHQGNGTAAIFSGRDDVFTFSMHQERNYPAYKPPSDLDVGLPDGLGDEAYLDALEAHLTGAMRAHGPDLVLYLAGADPYRGDQLGGLGLTREGLGRRDAFVREASRDVGAVLAVTLAGGYAIRGEDTVAIHAETVRRTLAGVGHQDPGSAR
jgi:acetoin utilization deacetylase AcuC-like enzyme